MKAKPIFFSQIDDSVIDFPLYNRPLQRISNRFPVIFGYSGYKYETFLRRFYDNITIIKSSKNNDVMKGKLIHDELKKRNDYNIAIRNCLDSVILDVDFLLDIIDEEIQNKDIPVYMGNPIYKIYEEDGSTRMARYGGDKNKIYFIRGSCMVMTRALINAVELTIISKLPYDKLMFRLAKKAGATIIPRMLFKIPEEYRETNMPVWHPPKRRRDKRLIMFKERCK